MSTYFDTKSACTITGFGYSDLAWEVVAQAGLAYPAGALVRTQPANTASHPAGEINDPGRQLPPGAIPIGTTVVVVLHLGLNSVYARALPASEIQRIAEHDTRNAIAPVAGLATPRPSSPALAAEVKCSRRLRPWRF
jgi:hypothetical protein